MLRFRSLSPLLLVFIALPLQSLLAANLVEPNNTVVPHDQTYYKQKLRNVELIYTEKNLNFADHVAELEMTVQPQYEHAFGYQLDSRLYVGLVSDHNQIANGFATTFPANRQINYIGGSQSVDYFSTTSWLDTLIFHESAHNYQLAARDNKVSSFLYLIIGNGTLEIPLIPITTPNVLESSYFLEGNAVLNESWHGNGGRLHSGRFKALTLAQAEAGNLTPALMYNHTLNFPYGERFYIVGGHYQYYMAQEYGLLAVNDYFKQRSQYWYWPFLVNRPLRNATGVNFNDSMSSWADKLKQEATNFKKAEGEILATSKSFAQMNSDAEEIFFIRNEKNLRNPELVRINKQSKAINFKTENYIPGRPVKVGQHIYTQASSHTSVWRISQGLFDENAYIHDGTKGKVIQGYFSDGRELYFDVAASYDQPQLYIDGEFYSQVNSSVIIDTEDNIYYFIQNADTRTLYKNKTALYTMPGYYSIVIDVDSQGRVLFIANSEMGSTLYRYSDGIVQRASEADNIVDARLINDDEVFISAIGADNYYYLFNPISLSNEQPVAYDLFQEESAKLSHQVTANANTEAHVIESDATLANDTTEDSTSYESQLQNSSNAVIIPTALTNISKAAATPDAMNLEHLYHSFFNLKYDSTSIFISAQSSDDDDNNNDDDSNSAELIYDINISFSDPLTQNTLGFYAFRDADLNSLAGISYSNSQSFLLIGANTYWVLSDSEEDPIQAEENRDFGYSAQMRLPFLQRGYWYGELDVNYYQDYQAGEREPLSAMLSFSRYKQFGISMFPTENFNIGVFASDERDDQGSGALFRYSHDLPYEIYIGVSAKYAQSDAIVSQITESGVKLSESASRLDNDPSTFYIPSLDDTLFSEKATAYSADISKVINLSAYGFVSPISLRREAITLGFTHYELDGLSGPVINNEINEISLGLTFETLFINKLVIPIGIQYVYSDNDEISNQDTFQFTLGASF